MYAKYNPPVTWKIYRTVSLLAVAALLGSQMVRADFKDDIGFTQLKSEYGSSLPSGAGVLVAQIEYCRDGFWAPFASDELAGKNFFYANSTFGGYSGHAYEVGCYLGGSTTSITPGLPGWTCFEATNYCAQQSLLSGRTIPPLTATWDIENHSWGGNDMIFGLCNLQRMDFRIERDNVVSVVGIDNASTMSMMMANAYNVISVGSSTGNHPHTGSTMEVKGRIKPELVGTATWTSYTTPIVASCATILVGETKRSAALSAARSSLVIKALLMAGATKAEFPGWQHTATQPLDTIYGAGEVNIYNSYKALIAGRQQPLFATPLSIDGWDVNTTSTAPRRLYYFSVPAGKQLTLSAVLAWYRHVQTSDWQTVASVVNNLDLVLWKADGSYNLQRKVSESISAIDNVEHIYEKLLGAGVYALEVVAPVSNEKYGLAWKGVLTDDGTPPVVNPPVVNPPVAGTISGGGFESPAVGANTFSAFVYGPGGTAWTFTGSSGVSGNNSGFSDHNPSAPEGGQVAFIQLNGSMEQVVSFAAGTYVINAQAAQRATWQSQNQAVDVYVDSQKVGSFSPNSTSYSAVSTNAFTVAAGSHNLKFVGQATSDATLFVDAVTLASAPIAPVDQPPAAATVSGSGFESPAMGTNTFSAFVYNPTGTAWTFSDRSGVAGNNSGFTDHNSAAPEGTQTAFIQMTGSVEQTVTFAAGNYVINAKAAQRGTWQLQSQVVDVYVDSQKVGSFSPGATSYSAVSTNAFSVAAGSHRIRFVGLATLDATLFIDAVTITASTTPVVTPNQPVSIAGKGFEAPNLGTNNFAAFAYVPSGSAWTFAGNSGIAGNNSGFTVNNPSAPEGTQVAFLQGSSAVVSQSVNFAATGTYSLVLSAASRGGEWNQALQIVNVYLDGNPAGTFTPSSTSYQAFTLSFNVAAGAHVLSFHGTVNADATALIDDIVIIGP